MGENAFGLYIKELRLSQGITLRAFCQEHGFDPGNHSRLERGLLPPPQKEEMLLNYAAALGLRPDSDEWMEFYDLAAAARGEIPKDLLSDEELLAKLPVLYRTLRGAQVPADKLDELIDKVRRA